MIKDFISLIFPKHCLISNAPLTVGEKYLSAAVVIRLPMYDLESSHLEQKFYGKVQLQNAFAYYKFTKGGRVQKILHALKYRNNPELGKMLGGWFGGALLDADQGQCADYIIPIPLHPSRLRQRGYNQSDKIAEGMSAVLNIPWLNNVLIRKKKTISQTGKDRLARFHNVENIFTVIRPDIIANKRILLVDDVITTGSTLEAGVVALRKGNPKSISIAALATA